MANIQVLDNPTIHELLINLSLEETIAFRKILEQTFEDVSVGGERQYQPMPSVANRANGQNTLFRPFTSDSSIGAKITVEPAPAPDGTKDPLHGIIVLTDGHFKLRRGDRLPHLYERNGSVFLEETRGQQCGFRQWHAGSMAYPAHLDSPGVGG